MARPKEYDKEKVLNAATELFWQKGYRGTSLSELVATTKLNKQSMYLEFGNKAGLFNACLNYYSKKMGKMVLNILTKEPLSIANIRSLFTEQQKFIASPQFKGCLFVNSANEQEHLDNTAKERINLFIKTLEKHFYNCLITKFSKTEAAVRADYLVHQFTGIMTIGKVRYDAKRSEALLKLALQVLDK